MPEKTVRVNSPKKLRGFAEHLVRNENIGGDATPANYIYDIPESLVDRALALLGGRSTTGDTDVQT